MKNKYVERLLKEWEQHKKIIIGVDYDDTVSPWSLNTEAYCDMVIAEVVRCQRVGAYVAVHTACAEDRYPEIMAYLHNKGVRVDSINKNPIDLPYGNTSKIYANIFLDDRAGLDEALHILSTTRNMYFDRHLALKEGETEF